MARRTPARCNAARGLRGAACVLLAGLASGAGAQELALAPGDPAPRTVGFDLSNAETELTWSGLTLVNFWATWCQPCQVEMPELQRIHEELSPRGFRVVGLQYEPGVTAEVSRDFLAHRKITFPTYLIESTAGWGGVTIFPTSFLVAPDGQILRKYLGGGGSLVDVMRRDIEDALAGRVLQPLPLDTLPPSRPAAPK